jgi:hypothetical protein
LKILAVDELDVHIGDIEQRLDGAERHQVVDIDIGHAGGGLDFGAHQEQAAALAEVWRVYCAVVANDSRMRRAMVARMPDMRVAGGTRSLESTMPPVPEPSPPISMPSSMRLFASEETRGDS